LLSIRRALPKNRFGFSKAVASNILPGFYPAARPLECHARNGNVPIGRMIEGRGYDLSEPARFHLRDFLRPLIDQQDHQRTFGVIGRHTLGDGPEDGRFPGLGRRHDQGALPLSERTEEIDDAGNMRDGTVSLRFAFEGEKFFGMGGRQGAESGAFELAVTRLPIDVRHFHQGRALAAAIGLAHFSVQLVTGAQSELPDQRSRDINIVPTGEIRGLRPAEKTGPVRQNIQNTE
jgi:hypothetical protein